jgi:hypothetical protein
MFDIRAIRETPDVFRKAWNRRKAGLGDETVSRILELDTAWRAATTAKQDAESARNANSKLIGQAKAKKDEPEAARLMALVADAKTAIEAAEAEEKTKRAALDDILMGLPNLPLDEVPEDGDISYGKFTDRKETIKLVSYAKKYRVSRRLIINDDLQALAAIPRAMGRADVLHQLSHPRLDKVARLYREAAHRPAQLAAVGQHVQRVSGMYLGNRQHHRLGWFDIARHDGLQRRADLEGDLNGVDALIRHRRVRALAMHVDGELVA